MATGGGGGGGHFHCQFKSIGRSSGRSATAAAAYRAREQIVDQRTGEIHDYTRRTGVEHTQIVMPAGAPAWNRAELWNAAEAAETRKNSMVAREAEIALPSQLSADDRKDLAVGFAREIAERHQVAVDVAVHAPGREGDQRNHHAHVMFTTRRIDGDGLTAKTREWNGREASATVTHWRERWAGMQNELLHERGLDDRVDHRSLAEQGIERMPQVHLGPQAAAMERAGRDSSRGVELEIARQAEVNPLAKIDKRELRDQVATAPTRRAIQVAIDKDIVIVAARERISADHRVQVDARMALDVANHKAASWREAHPARTWIHEHGITAGAGPLTRIEKEIEHHQEIDRDAGDRVAADERVIEDRREEIAPAIAATLEPGIAAREAARLEIQIRDVERQLERQREREDRGISRELGDDGLERERGGGGGDDNTDDAGTQDERTDFEKFVDFANEHSDQPVVVSAQALLDRDRDLDLER